MMKRKENWETELTAYLRSVAHKPFSWHDHNCFIFTVEAIEAMTGSRQWIEDIGEWKNVCADAETAEAYIKTHGYKSHIHLISKHFKARPSRLHMNRGDIAILRDLNGLPALGICQGERVYMAGPTGLVTAPANLARKAFAV